MTLQQSFFETATVVKERETRARRLRTQMLQLCESMNNLYEHSPKERPLISNPSDVTDLLQPILGELDHEELWLVSVNIRMRVIRLSQIYVGTVDGLCPIRVADLMRELIISNAYAFVVVHNHPSGDPSPSTDDIKATTGIIDAGKLLDIQCLDHIIIAGSNYVSLKEKGVFG